MIARIELEETIANSYTTLLILDFEKEECLELKNDTLFRKRALHENAEDITSLAQKYITYWQSKYINPSMIDGKEIYLRIYVDGEKMEYHFQNEYPYNYAAFIDSLKERMDIV